MKKKLDSKTNYYIESLRLNPKREAAVRKIVTLAGGSGGGGMVEITYAELKELRDSAKLVPGCKYRMIDYETTTSQEGTQAAGHPFDLILTALDEKTLDEKCSAIQSARDVDGYFANSNLAAWEVWYCLDNNSKSWGVIGGEHIKVDDSGQQLTTYRDGVLEYQGIIYNKYKIIGDWNGFYCITQNDKVNVNDIMNLYNSSWGVVLREVIVTEVKYVKDGKGVIYKMKDENNNEAPFDFKNILHYNKINDVDYWGYTFYIKYYDDEDECYKYDKDGSLNSYDYTGFVCNKLEVPYDNLPNILVSGNNNIFGTRNDSIIINGDNNIFGDDCSNIILNNLCHNNRFGGNNHNISFDNGFCNMEISYNASYINGTSNQSHYTKYIINVGGSYNNPLNIKATNQEKSIIFIFGSTGGIYTTVMQINALDIYNVIQTAKAETITES